MEDFESSENSLEESDSGSELSDIGHEVPLGDGSCPTISTPIFESANSSKSMSSGGGPNRDRLSASRGSVQTSTPRRAFGNSVNAAVLSPSNEILVELKKVNTCLESFCDRLDSLDGRLKSVEDMQVNLSTSVSSSTEESASKTKRRVPSRVSVSFSSPFLSLSSCHPPCQFLSLFCAWVYLY